mmetsp:Transcript_2369/g.5017  ORF Transcript_2369/g.5017 Transcript_2369/m.5017 type:complete len:313 (+) Transcript_2369:47-985(+)
MHNCAFAMRWLIFLPLQLALLCAWRCNADKAADAWQEKKREDGRVVQEMKIEAPAMTEEDQYGHVMPERYRCDSCKAVVHHLDADLRKKQKSRRMKAWEYTELFDDTCRNSFTGYGIRLINGENTLSGPGLKTAEDLAPGSGAIQMGGEAWNKRLGEICRKIVYEDVGEDEVYDKFYSNGQLAQELCNETKHCSGKPSPPKDGAKSKEKKASKPEKSKAPKERKPEPAAEAASPAGQKSKASDTQTVQATMSQEPIDVKMFLRSLAQEHGLPAEDYLSARTKAEWEKLTVSMASRLFGRLADSNQDGSCRAS